MKALQVKNGVVGLNDVAFVHHNEAKIRVTMSGICNTDVEIVRGYANFSGTIGHEFVGVVEESVTRPEIIGKRVVGEINAGCEVCEQCKKGDTRHCPQRTVLGIVGRDGCHAEYVALPSQNLLVVPENVTDEQAVFAEPLAAALGIMEQVAINQGDRVAVIGDGKLGILCAMGIAANTDKTVLIGKHSDKIALVRNANVEGILLSDAGRLSNKSFDVVVEASGSETGFATALDLVKPRGKLVLKSTFHGKPQWEAWRVVVDEITVVGSRCGRFKPAIEALKHSKIDVMPLISEKIRLKDGVNAMSVAQQRGIMKVLLVP